MYTPLYKDIQEPTNFINPIFEPPESAKSKGSKDHARYLFPSMDEKDKLHPYSVVVESGISRRFLEFENKVKKSLIYSDKMPKNKALWRLLHSKI